MAARLALEEHWAVAALPIGDRERARALGRRMWRRGAPRLGEPWAVRDHELIGRVAGAYEVAALEHVGGVATTLREMRRLGIVPPAADDDAPRARVDVASPASTFAAVDALRAGALARLADALDTVRGAADVTFGFVRVQPLPWGPGQLPHVLRALSIGAVSDDAAALAQWSGAAQAARRGADGGDLLPLVERWDAHLRDAIVALWLDLGTVLLGAPREPAPDAVERAFATVARLREARQDREAELLVSLPGVGVQRARAQLQVLYALLDATAHLVAWARRGDVDAGVPGARVALAGALALTAGDRALDTALQWLDYAIALPPLVAGLPPDTHDAARAANAAHGAPHAAGSGVGDAVSDQPLAGRRPRRG